MLKQIITVRGRFGLALTAALIAGSMGMPSSAPAAPGPQQPAQLSCDPGSDRCFPLYRWYSDDTYSTIVGNGMGNCDDNTYIVTSGYQTPWGELHGWAFCPD